MTELDSYHLDSNHIRVAHLIYSSSMGGSEMLASEISGRLDRRVFHPLCIFMYPGDGKMRQLLHSNSVDVFELQYSRLRRCFGPLFPYALLSRIKPTILHVHHVSLFANILPAARLARIPHIVLTEHANRSISRSPKLQEASLKAAELVGCFTAVSHNLKNYFVKEIGIQPSKIMVIHNGVDSSRYTPGTKSEALKCLLPPKHTGTTIISVGRIVDAKDQSSLITALKILKSRGLTDFHLVLIGEGDLRSSLEAQIRNFGLTDNVSLAGSRTDVEQLLRGVDMFVLPSKREGFPVALLEAMASGLPVIATNVGGIPEAIKNMFNGVLVPSSTPQALADAIDWVIRHPDDARRMGTAARQTVIQEFSLDNIALKYSGIYLSLIRSLHK